MTAHNPFAEVTQILDRLDRRVRELEARLEEPRIPDEGEVEAITEAVWEKVRDRLRRGFGE